MATKLEFGVHIGGRSLPIWHYEVVPDGMRPAKVTDLYYGRPVLYQVRAGPHTGEYYSDYVRQSTIGILRKMIEKGLPVYVQDHTRKN